MIIDFENFANECTDLIYEDDELFFGIISNQEYNQEIELKKNDLLNLIKDINTNVYECDLIMFVLEKMFIANHTYKKINRYIEDFINLIEFLFKNNNLLIDFQLELTKCYKTHNIKHLQNIFWKTDKLDPKHKYNYKFYIKKIKPNKINILLTKDKNNNKSNYENYLLGWLLSRTHFITTKNYSKINKILKLLLNYNKIEKIFLEDCYNNILNSKYKNELENILLVTMKEYIN
jgi:hypothetical protein